MATKPTVEQARLILELYNLRREPEMRKARLVSHKVPREIRFCGELPKTVTGKIQRFKLRASSTHG